MLSSQNLDPNASGHRRFFLLRWALALWHSLFPATRAQQDRQSGAARLAVAWGFVLVCVAGVVLSLVYARPIYGKYKEWRSDRLVRQARDLRAKGDIVGAVISAGRAAIMTPEFEPAVRMNAEMLTMISHESALYFWDKLARMGVITLEDKMGWVKALEHTHRDKEAAQMLEELLKSHPEDSRLLMMGEEVWGQRAGGIQMTVLKDYVAKHPENREIRLRLLKLQEQNGGASPAQVSEGLWQLAEARDDISLNALRKLAEMDSLDGPSRNRVADELDQHPQTTEADRVAALGLRVAQYPAKRNQLLDEAVNRVRGFKPDKLVPLVRWLATHREPGRVLTLLSEDDIKKDEHLLGDYLNALTSLGRSKDLARIVNDRSFTLRAAARTFYQAHLALINGEPREQIRDKLLLVRGDLSTSGQDEMLLTLGQYCQERQFYDVAESAFEAAAKSPRVRIERPGFAAWIQCCKVSGNTDALVEATTEACRRWPDDQAFLEESLYAKLLQGTDIEISLARAESLLAASPEDPARKLLTGLGYLRLSYLDNSVSACQRIDLKAVSPGQKAVFAAIFHDAGAYRVAQDNPELFRQQLKTIVDEIPTGARMLPEEAAFLRRARE